MKTFSPYIKTVAQILLFGGILLIVVWGITKMNIPQTLSENANVGYPAPRSYPPPSPDLTVTPTTPLINPSPTDQEKGFHPLSSTEFAAWSTELAGKQAVVRETMLVPPPYLFPLQPMSDLPKIILKDPLVSHLGEDILACISNNDHFDSILVHALNHYGDYYIVAFYKGNKVCGKLLVRIKNNTSGEVAGWSESRETFFPQVSSDEAVSIVEKQTGLKASGTPQLVSSSFIGYTTESFDPFWLIQTTDGKSYYVFFLTGPVEEGGIKTSIEVKPAESLQPRN